MSMRCLLKLPSFRQFLLIAVANYCYALQNQYVVFQEDMQISDVDQARMDVTAGVFPVDKATNALNLTAKFKFTLPADAKFAATAFKWINGDYRLGLVNIFKTIRSGLEMEMFDLQSLFVHYCRPPLVWPVIKGVSYHCTGWSPDSTTFPANLPGGRWKVPITIMFANNTKLVVATWYLKLTYKKNL